MMPPGAAATWTSATLHRAPSRISGNVDERANDSVGAIPGE